MTREEAARLLEYHLKNEPTYIGLDDALRMAIAALNEAGSPTAQLDENGLMPCGCGGKVDVAFYPGWHGVPDMYQVDCFNCHVGTRPCQTAEQAKAVWNAAMGYKEAGE